MLRSGRLRSRALVSLLAAGLVSPAFSQVVTECGSVSIATYEPPSPSTYEDEGLARQQCEADKSAHPAYHNRQGGGRMDLLAGQGSCIPAPSQPNAILWRLQTNGQGKWSNDCSTASPLFPAGTNVDKRLYYFSQSCATRPQAPLSWTDSDASRICHNGCEYSGGSVCTWIGGTYYCGMSSATPTGATCPGSGPIDPQQPDPPDPEPDPDPNEPDPDPDPDPNEPDPDPNEPDPDPEEPDPEEPEPEEPDPNEPNQPGQNVDMSGVESRLDALKQSVDVIPPKLDAIATAIARAGRCVGRGPGDGVVDECDNMSQPVPEGNTVSGGGDCESEPVCTGDPAQCAMVRFAWRNQCETKRLADALTSNGEGEGEGEGDPGTTEPGPDLSEYAQDPDTDGLVDSIWQDAQDGEMELDTAGFGGSRSCPLLSLSIPAWMGTPNFAPVCNVMGFLANLFFAIAAVWGLAVVWRK